MADPSRAIVGGAGPGGGRENGNQLLLDNIKRDIKALGAAGISIVAEYLTDEERA